MIIQKLMDVNYKYIIHFEPNQLHDVKYFWALTM